MTLGTQQRFENVNDDRPLWMKRGHFPPDLGPATTHLVTVQGVLRRPGGDGDRVRLAAAVALAVQVLPIPADAKKEASVLTPRRPRGFSASPCGICFPGLEKLVRRSRRNDGRV